LFSAGRTAAMTYVQPLLMVAAASAVSAASVRLFPTVPVRVAALVPFLAGGLTAGLTGGFAEPVAIAFAIWAVVLARSEHWVGAGALLSLAILTRENAAAALVGLVAWQLMRRRTKGAALLATGLIPVAAWYLVIRSRYGYFPQNDPFLPHAFHS